MSFINKVSLYSSSPTFFNNYIEDRFNPSKNKSSINKYGFTLNDKTGIFYKEKFDSLKICDLADKRLNRRHWKISIQNYNANTIKIKEVINFCKSNKIKVVLLRMPVYATYKKRYNIEKLNRNLLFLKKLIKKDEVELLSFENDTDFHLKDFKDDDHLNEFGAKKLCKKINLYLTTKK